MKLIPAPNIKKNNNTVTKLSTTKISLSKPSSLPKSISIVASPESDITNNDLSDNTVNEQIKKQNCIISDLNKQVSI